MTTAKKSTAKKAAPAKKPMPTTATTVPTTAVTVPLAEESKKATIKGAQQAGHPSWPGQPGVPPPANL